MDQDTPNPLALAIDKAGGLSKVAAALGLSTSRLANWIKRGVPAENCPDVEGALGIRCELLRPDVNWAVLRVQPEAAAPMQREEGAA